MFKELWTDCSTFLINKFTESVFTATCVKAGGGRPFIPEELARAIELYTTNL